MSAATSDQLLILFPNSYLCQSCLENYQKWPVNVTLYYTPSFSSVQQEWMQKSSEFAQFIQTQESRPEVMGLKINALLITPVQRIPRWGVQSDQVFEMKVLRMNNCLSMLSDRFLVLPKWGGQSDQVFQINVLRMNDCLCHRLSILSDVFLVIPRWGGQSDRVFQLQILRMNCCLCHCPSVQGLWWLFPCLFTGGQDVWGFFCTVWNRVKPRVLVKKHQREFISTQGMRMYLCWSLSYFIHVPCIYWDGGGTSVMIWKKIQGVGGWGALFLCL